MQVTVSLMMTLVTQESLEMTEKR